MKITATQLRRIIKEEVDSLASTVGKNSQRFLHGFESGNPTDDEGYMIKSRMTDVKEMAETICGLLDEGDQLPAWVQDLVSSAHTDLEHVKDYLTGDEKMRNGGKASSLTVAAEGRNHRGGMLLEGHARITPDEMSAWMGGDWGYIADDAEKTPPCPECGGAYAIDGDEPGTLLCHDCGNTYSKEDDV